MARQSLSPRTVTDQPYVLAIDDDAIVGPLIGAATGLAYQCFARAGEVLERDDLPEPVAIFLDIHLHEENGLDALQALRQRWRYTPILVITADTAEKAIGEALSLGADDFLLKPLRPQEVTARLQARLNDQAAKQAKQITAMGDIEVDHIHRLLRGPKGDRFLSPTELSLLVALIQGAGTTLERSQLKNRCWDQIAVSDNALDRKVFEVRRALHEVGSLCRLGTAYGVGFYLHPGLSQPPRAGAPASDR